MRVAGEPPELLSPSYFFRPPSRMGTIDRTALERAVGRVLDVGAGAGAHALPLQRRGLAVTALETLPAAARVLRERGTADVREESVWSFRPRAPYDTVLALMNGTALAGTRARLGPLLGRLRELVAPGGQLLIDSTEVGEMGEVGEPRAPGPGTEAGEGFSGEGALELHYQLEYRGKKGPPFPQLLVASGTLARIALAEGWLTEVVARRGGRYLARMTPGARGAGSG